MSYKRQISKKFLKGEDLTRSMVGIGMLFGAKPEKNPNIEDTIISASYQGIVSEDFRILSMLTKWLEQHFFIINASRLIKLIKEHEDNDIFLRYWISVSQWQAADNRFRSLRDLGKNKKKKEITKGSLFLSKKNGEDTRFKGTCLVVPKKMLDREDWLVLSPEKMTNYHLDYKWRLIIGPSFRADMWSQLERDNALTPSSLAKAAYGSYATAHRTKKEFQIYRKTAI